MNHFLALDIGNVCLAIDRNACFRKLGIDVPPPEVLREAAEFECGRITEEQFFSTFTRSFPERNEMQEQLRDAFNSILLAPVPGMPELVASLAGRGIEVVFFSDISSTHLARFRELFPGAAAFPGIYSFEVGAQKPSPEMFLTFERLYGVPALYADDRADLIAGARTRGWNARQFISADDLSETLLKITEKIDE